MNSYSISTNGIAESLQTSGSALVAAGNDFDKSVALVTAAIYKMAEYIEICTKNTFNCWKLLRAFHHNIGETTI